MREIVLKRNRPATKSIRNFPFKNETVAKGCLSRKKYRMRNKNDNKIAVQKVYQVCESKLTFVEIFLVAFSWKKKVVAAMKEKGK